MKLEARLRVKEKGHIVIPAAFRKVLGIQAGSQLILHIEDGELRITTMQPRIARAQRLVKKHIKPRTSLVDELISERRRAAY